MSLYGDIRRELQNHSSKSESTQLALIERAENFQRELLNNKLSVMDKLADSITQLATNMITMKPPIIISINIDNNTDPKHLKELIESLR